MNPLPYELPWNGHPFSPSAFIALDTETCVQRPDGTQYDLSREIPPLVLATATDGLRCVVLTPEQLPTFICRHDGRLIVGHNIAFDYWTVAKAVEGTGAHGIWASLPERNLMDDTMLLDFLVRLATSDSLAARGMRNLGELARMVGERADKESPYRLRFHELVGKDWSREDRGFFDYAVADTYVTWRVYADLLERARTLASQAGIDPLLSHKHGHLTSKLQVRASIVLADVGKRGMALDASKVDSVQARLREQVDDCVDRLAAYNPPLFRYYVKNPRTGERKVNKRTLVPNLDFTALRSHLIGVAEREGADITLLPRTPTGAVSTALDYWRKFASDSPLIRDWALMADTAKLLQFTVQVEGRDTIHPGYRVLVRTGRTSCTKPNVQQMPRESWFRELFIPRPGYRFAIVDYSAIELRTLAAVLLGMYGKSRLAEVLREGMCPHTHTASMVAGISYEALRDGIQEEKASGSPGKYSQARQAAKAINFGVPGGLGAKRLCEYARLNYGVDMTEAEASRLKQRLIREVYPELQYYLSQDIVETLAANLRCSSGDIISALARHGIPDWHISSLMRRGSMVGAGERMVSLPQEVQACIWDTLSRLNNNPDLARALETWEASRELWGETAITLTGRIRSGLDYGECRNTRFQGLAADGAKVALWRLFVAGFRIVGFVHDEFICEVPTHSAEAHLAHMERIMCESMASVIGDRVPVAVEGHLSDSWTK